MTQVTNQETAYTECVMGAQKSLSQKLPCLCPSHEVMSDALLKTVSVCLVLLKAICLTHPFSINCLHNKSLKNLK